jgi:hypothetical protein
MKYVSKTIETLKEKTMAALKSSQQERIKSVMYTNHGGYTAYLNSSSPLANDPSTYRYAMSRTDAEMWQQAATNKLTSRREKGVYKKVDLPTGKTVLPSTLVLTVQREERVAYLV